MIFLHAAFAAFLLVHSATAEAEVDPNLDVKEQVAIESDEGVLVLTKNNFENLVKSSEYLLVKFCK